MAAQADNKKGVAGIMRAKGKKIASDRNGLAGMSSRCTWPPGEHLSFYIRACKCGRFRPSLRDLILVWRLIPGLKAWAIFKSPSGTHRKVRCSWPPVRRDIHFGRGRWLSTLAVALIAGFGLIPADRGMAQTFTVLHSFTATDPNTGADSDGAGPDAGLFLSGNTLHGTAQIGGSSGNGTVFSLSLP